VALSVRISLGAVSSRPRPQYPRLTSHSGSAIPSFVVAEMGLHNQSLPLPVHLPGAVQSDSKQKEIPTNRGARYSPILLRLCSITASQLADQKRHGNHLSIPEISHLCPVSGQIRMPSAQGNYASARAVFPLGHVRVPRCRAVPSCPFPPRTLIPQAVSHTGCSATLRTPGVSRPARPARPHG
jgi:hypothetical protein